MAKITTKELKNNIVQWIKREEIYNDLKEYYYGCGEFSKSNCFDDVMFKRLSDPKNWLRDHKSKLKDDNDTYSFDVLIFKDGNKNVFACDIDGDFDQVLVDFYSDPVNKNLRKKLTIRTFVHSYRLYYPDYRVEVLTDHNDEKIVGWCFTCD
jgi:hypothetical protein